MSVSAQLAQNSRIYIGSGTGSAVTITAITQAFKAQITGTHTLAVGDVVTFASVVGMTNINGLSATVLSVTGTTAFVVDIDSRLFTAYSSAGTATPITYTQIKEIKTVKPSGAAASKLDVTDLDSTAKEYRAGLIDNGTVSCDIHILESDPGQIAALAAFTSSVVKPMKFVTPAKTRTFSGTILKFPTAPDASVDGVQTGNMEFQINGTVTVA